MMFIYNLQCTYVCKSQCINYFVKREIAVNIINTIIVLNLYFTPHNNGYLKSGQLLTYRLKQNVKVFNRFK